MGRKIKKKYYRKLIRDNIPEKIENKGEQYSCRILSQKEFEQELIKKAGEEAGGLLNAKSKKELVEELVDVLDVIDEIIRIKKIQRKQIKNVQKKNHKVKGGFRKKLFLIWSEDVGYVTNEPRGKKKK